MTQQNEATRKEAALVDDIRRELDGPPGSPDGRRQLLARALAALTKAAPPVEAAHVLDASGLNCSCHARFSTQWEAREHAGLSHGGPLAALATPLPVDAGGGLETLVVRLVELLAKASLPWEVDSEHDGDAEYGGGPDPDRGYDNFIVFDGKGQIVADTINSDAKCIVEEPHCDEDGYRSAWDETGKANTDLIVEAVNALPMLLAALASPPVAGDRDAATGGGLSWPTLLTPELRAILGFMCFQLGGPAHRYQKAGEFVGSEGALKKRAEDEQAFMLHKLLGFWIEHGADWSKAAQADLDRVKALTDQQAAAKEPK